METIRGKQTSFVNLSGLRGLCATYDGVHVDVGTGDGRFVRDMAKAQPRDFIIGLDASRENLQKTSRTAPDNALFVIANAAAMPAELHGIASSISVNFPWGSLIQGLLVPDSPVLHGIQSLCVERAHISLYLNAGALAEAGAEFENGVEDVYAALRGAGFLMERPVYITSHTLKTLPTTWAKRLAFGRDPRAAYIQGVRR